MVLGCIALGMLFVSGVRLGPGHQGAGRAGRPWPDRGGRLALPAGAAALVPRSLGPQLGLGLPGRAVADRAGFGPPLRRRSRRRAGSNGASSRTPTPTSSSRSSARSSGIVGAVAGAGPAGRASSGSASGPPSQSPDRFGGLLALGLVAWVASRDPYQHRGRGRRPPGHRHPASVHLLRRARPSSSPWLAAGILINIARQGRRPGRPRCVRGAGRAGRPRPRAAGVGERTARHGDRRRRDRRPHRAVAADRPGAGRPGHPARADRALRLSPWAGGHALADPRVPLHPAARAGHPAQHAPVRLVGQRGRRRSAWPGPASAPSAPSSAAGPGWWSSSGATPASRPDWPPCVTRVPLVLGQHRRRAGRRQRSPGSLRRSQRGRLSGNGPARGPTSPARRCGPSSPRSTDPPEGRASSRGRTRPARRPPDGGHLRRLAGGAAYQPGGGRPGRRLGQLSVAVSLYQVTGRRDYEPFVRRGPWRDPTSGRGATVRVASDGCCTTEVGRPSRIACRELYSAADVCVSRAGAMTVAELLMTGVPAILVPLPGAPRDHQTRNAEALVGGRGGPVPDAECDGPTAGVGARRAPVRPGAPARHARAAAAGTRTPTRRPVSPSWSTPMPADPSRAPALDVSAPELGRPSASTSWASAARA